MKKSINLLAIFIYLILSCILLSSTVHAGQTCSGSSCFGQSIDIADFADHRTLGDPDFYGPLNSTGELTGAWNSFHIEWDISYNSGTSL